MITPSRLVLVVLVLGGLATAPQGQAEAPEAAPQKLLDLLAQGKVDTDVGHYDTATQALTAVADAPAAPPTLRAEAFVRLGAARRGAGDWEGAVRDFERASRAPGLDNETKALLVWALGGALPGAERWAQVAPRVSFAVDRSAPKRPTLAIVWPDVPAKQPYRGKPISLDFKDGDLQDVLRLFADISGLNVVVNPGVRGQVTFKVKDEAWDSCLDRVLAPNGLAYQWEDTVLRIALPQQLPAPRHFSGERIDVEYKDRDLVEVLTELAATGGVTAAIDPRVGGRMTLKLNKVRWDQAFDIVVSVNGLDWVRSGKVLKVRTTDFRS